MLDQSISYRDLINNLEAGIFRYSLDAKGRFLFANNALAKMIGYHPDILLKMNFLDLCEDPGEMNRLNTKICSEGYVKSEWLRLKKKDGQVIQCAISAALAKNKEGKDLLIDGIMEDITEHKKAREGLLQAKLAAEEANSAKSLFLANMSHEVRTPMNAIIGMLDLTLETDLTNDQKDNLMTAKEAADNLLSLLNDILDISRVEAGKVTLETIGFDLWSLVERVVKGLSVLAHKKNLQILLEIEAQTPRAVMGDPTRIRQIVINLVNNAIKFTTEGKVEVRLRSSPGAEGEVQFYFSVSDTGIGIPKDKQGGLFEIFAQADNSVTRRYGGTGLGLAICKRLVEMMQGRIWLESEEGVGSTFHLAIPLKTLKAGEQLPGVSTAPAKKEPAPKGLRILTILLAEDNPLNQKIAVKLLEKRGWLVEIAVNGQEALDRVSEKTFDLVLMDVQMPVLDGFEATKIIRSQEQKTGTHLPIVAMTAKAMAEDEKRCLDAGMDAYISKPIDAAKVYETIEEVLGRGKGRG